MKIAIGYDSLRKRNLGIDESFSEGFKTRCDARGIEATIFKPMEPGFLSKVRDYDAFIWRYNGVAPMADAAPRLIRSVEADLGLPVWPERRLRDTFENKIAQAYLLESFDIPHPKTWIFWNREEAIAALDTLDFPLVAKLSQGIMSNGVRLIRDKKDGLQAIDHMFTFGLAAMDYDASFSKRMLGKYALPLRQLRRGTVSGRVEQGYLLLQEFLPDNDHDNRVIIQGDRAFAKRRMNRENDFRASGSNLSDFDLANMRPEVLEFGFEVADKLGVKSLVLDVMFRGDQPVISEMSYTTSLTVVQEWPNHWLRTPDGIAVQDHPFDWPEAIIDDFLEELQVETSTQSFSLQKARRAI